MIISVTTVILLLFQKQKLDVSSIKCWIAFEVQYAVCIKFQIAWTKKEWEKEKQIERKLGSVSNAEQ